MTYHSDGTHTIDNSEENPALLEHWQRWGADIIRLTGMVTNHPKQPSPEAMPVTTTKVLEVRGGRIVPGALVRTKNTWYKLGTPEVTIHG